MFAVVIIGCKRRSTSPQVISNETNSSDFYINRGDFTEVKISWQQLIQAASYNNHEQFKNISLDTIIACSKSKSRKEFFACVSELFDPTLYDRIKDSSKIEFQDSEKISSYYSSSFLSRLKHWGNTFIIKRVRVDLKDDEQYILAFDFIETKDGYKLYSCDVYGGPICCR